MQSLKSFCVGIIPALLILTMIGCRSGNNSTPQHEGETGINIVPVEAAMAVRRPLAVTKAYSGTLEGEEQANIVAKISERVTGINARVGESVQPGQVLITLDKSGTTSQYFQAEAAYKNAQKTLERMKSLYAEGAISLQALDGTQTAFDVAKANFDAARSAVELTTPIAGVVTAVNVSMGDLSMPGAVLMTVARINRIKVIFSLNETDVTNLAIGQGVTVYSEARPGTKMQGQIVQLSKSADVGSRSFEVKALFPNTNDHWFKPGMFARVAVQVSPKGDALVIPTAAIQSDGQQNTVFLVRNGRAMQRTVQTGLTDGDDIEILDGIAFRDTVATVGINNLKDSSHVRVVNR